ncbi:DUF29 domain-containing protein [Pseudoduganella violacea]|uniref:DUF29 family protein n=1 Tax=Pseudoduganella violacea TaxID=1715466 RepID=A0A7W5BAW9_9BURK|nr:DUF29 domain-containing protein [Pseudoduganella violacea]MBB3119010.1 hypothetical protein [Pseudoduganella violacea]
MLDFKDQTPIQPGYEEDFALWLDAQAALLRSGQFGQLDIENLTEELHGMSSSLHRELGSRLVVLIKHLLKCEFQPKRKSRSWHSTIHEQRREIDALLETSPSLRHRLPEYCKKAYPHVLKEAANETGLPDASFPPQLPYTIEKLLNADFLP